jgi:hypothetical protein
VERPRHRPSRLPPAPAGRLVLALFKGAALGALLLLVVAGGPHTAARPARPGTTAASESDRVVERAVTDHRCSYAGSGREAAVSASALIRTTGGELRQVSFEVGWDVYNGRRPGTLVAVCLDEP